MVGHSKQSMGRDLEGSRREARTWRLHGGTKENNEKCDHASRALSNEKMEWQHAEKQKTIANSEITRFAENVPKIIL
jgi:hypothetical protein